MTPAARAEAAIIEQIVDAVEARKQAHGLTVSDLATRGRVSPRTVKCAGKLQTRHTLRTLLSLAHSVGLELDIRIRTPRTSQEGTPSNER